MRPLKSILFVLVTLQFMGCQTRDEVNLVIKNNSSVAEKDALVRIPLADLKKATANFDEKSLQIVINGVEIPYQIDDTDGDGKGDELVTVLDLKSGEEVTVKLVSGSGIKTDTVYPKRTQAELSHKTGGKFEGKKYIGGEFKNVSFVRVPDPHTDHDTFFRYEGPGWESEKVGYRFYLDWRNATDIYGKKMPAMVLQDVGQDGFDSYHEMSDWGMDVLKVGSSLGIGSIGMWYKDKVQMVNTTDSITCSIVTNGPVYSMIRTKYYGWQIEDKKFDLVSEFSIAAGDRKTMHQVKVSDSADNLCTGLVKHEKSVIFESEAAGEWQYIASYGNQSLAGDDDLLGMAVLYRKKDLIKRTEDDQSDILVLKPEQGMVTYYFLAAWVQEPDGISDAAQFKTYLEEEVQKLDNPVSVKIGI